MAGCRLLSSFVLVAATSTPALATPQFHAPYVSYALSSDAAGLALADLNGDGRRDVLLPMISINRLGIALRQPDGSLGALALQVVPTSPNAVAAADLDADGNIDAVTVHRFTSSAQVLYGTGSGTFLGATTLPVGPGGDDLAIADLTGDGKPDLLFSVEDSLKFVRNLGARTFAPAVSFPITGGGQEVLIADFDEDGVSDVAVACVNSHVVSVLRGIGDGAFHPRIDYPTSQRPYGLAAADLDEDGDLDLAIGCDYWGELTILPGVGDGTFAGRVDYPVGGGARYVVAFDPNLDGHVDLVVGAGGGVRLFFGDGSGTFGAPVIAKAGQSPRQIEVADLNGDGLLDLTVVNPNSVVTLHDHGGGTFGLDIETAVGAYPWDLELADFNGDQFVDAATADQEQNQVSILLGDGLGGFPARLTTPAGAGPEALVSGDLDEDGNTDLAVLGSDDNVRVLLGDGDGTFTSGAVLTGGTSTEQLALADLNEDGHLDLAVTSLGSGVTTVRLLLGDGTGEFSPGTPAFAGYRTSGIKAADVDADGHLDLVVTHGFQHSVSALLGNGDGTFDAPKRYPGTLYEGYAVEVADLDGDSRLDLIVQGHLGAGPTNLIRLKGAGNGEFTFFDGLAAPIAAGMVAHDLDDDGHVDLAVTTGYLSMITVFPGGPGGTVGPVVHYGEANGAYAISVADFDRNGRPDLVTANAFVNTVSLLRSSLPPPLAVDPPPSGSGALRIEGVRWSSEGLLLRFQSPQSAPAQVELFDLAGRRLWSQSGWSASAGANRLTFHATGVRTGLHYLRLRVAGESATAKAVRIH